LLLLVAAEEEDEEGSVPAAVHILLPFGGKLELSVSTSVSAARSFPFLEGFFPSLSATGTDVEAAVDLEEDEGSDDFAGDVAAAVVDLGLGFAPQMYGLTTTFGQQPLRTQRDLLPAYKYKNNYQQKHFILKGDAYPSRINRKVQRRTRKVYHWLRHTW
jgi:hypothetical protein